MSEITHQQHRHCERLGEAIQESQGALWDSWIASSQALLAMTETSRQMSHHPGRLVLFETPERTLNRIYRGTGRVIPSSARGATCHLRVERGACGNRL